MAWWLPTTWFENLGSARRTSTFKLSHEKRATPLSGQWKYHATCSLALPDGSTIEESASMLDFPYRDFLYSSDDPVGGYGGLIRTLREKIRAKYPKN